MDVWKNDFNIIRDKLRAQMHAKGKNSLQFLVEAFQQFDTDGSRSLNKREFEQLMSYCGLFLSTQEISSIFRRFDSNKDNSLQFDEFINTLRGELSIDKQDAIQRAWNVIDPRNTGSASLHDLFSAFQVQRHPRVRTRQKSADQVLSEMESALLYTGGNITFDDFYFYFADINASLPEFESHYFEEILSCFGPSSSAGSVDAANVPESKLLEMEGKLVEKIRQLTHGSEDEGKVLYRTFRFYDRDRSGAISMEEFKFTMVQLGLLYSDAYLRALFNRYDTDGSGSIVYEEFVNALRRYFVVVVDNPTITTTASSYCFKDTRAAPSALFDKIQRQLAQGGRDFSSLEPVFRRNDPTSQQYLRKREFAWAVREAGLDLNEAEMEKLVRHYDRTRNDQVAYLEMFSDYNRWASRKQ
eukprot:GILI01011499.1.p1 GENE.GILI01011499.1~~GILI01011499.1.p1  ORF type:complete len:413 (-),score=104.93 GILI01011499.1:34-1272(-)